MAVKKRVIQAAALVVALLLCSAAVGADWSPAKADRDKPIDVQASTLSAEKEGWVVAAGDVIIRQGDTQLTADKVSINKETGEIIAEGGVVLIRENQIATRAESLTYNFKTGRGETPDVKLRVGPLRVLAKDAVREADDTFT